MTDAGFWREPECDSRVAEEGPSWREARAVVCGGGELPVREGRLRKR